MISDRVVIIGKNTRNAVYSVLNRELTTVFFFNFFSGISYITESKYQVKFE